jgi:superfamily II DNA or RNA helicase
LEKGIGEDINAPYKFVVIGIKPDTTTADIPAGSKDKPFNQTEFAAHNYLNKAIQMCAAKGELDTWKGKALVTKRMRMIYNSATKRRAARHILTKIYKPDKRILVFGGSIEQIETLLPKYAYHSGTAKDKKTGTVKYAKPPKSRLEDFKVEKINILATVGMLDEGANVSNLDYGLIIQADQVERRMIQRMGRLVRKREGYEAIIYGIFLRGTQDEKWFNNSISSLPSYRVFRFNYESLQDFQNATEWIMI